MIKKYSLLHVTNRFHSNAIINIIRDLHPVIGEVFEVSVVVLQNCNHDDPAFMQFQKLGISVKALNCHRHDVPGAFLKLRRHIYNTQPDIVHAHLGRAEMLAPLCAPPRTPVIATSHSVKSGYHPLTRLFLSVTDRRLAHRICVSHAVAKSWTGRDSSKCSVIYNPVDTGRFAALTGSRERIRGELSMDEGTFLFLAVGRLVPQKGYPVLLQAVARLKQTSKTPFRLAIAGRGPEEGRLKAMAGALDVLDQVQFLGFRNDVPDLLCAADAFVFPSLWEGLGLAALEAMAAGIPVAASACPAICEYITHGETGLLSEPGDSEGLTCNLLALVEGAHNLDAASIQEGIVSKFCASYIGEHYKDLYNNAIARLKIDASPK